MAAVVYLRVSYPDKPPVVRLVCSKTKVGPLERLTIPRLELSAAALLARLTKEVILANIAVGQNLNFKILLS
ncbi:hypothetical protein M0802_014064 [Mischocyttarus mexicanus]|nr:hypothetical protein M0802_014064 [Mischocyttarus mexicanus]